MSNNLKSGHAFEDELCDILAAQGFWVYNTINKPNGQPADIITAKNGVAWLMDAKVVNGNRFPLSRIEYNQRSAASAWNRANNGSMIFVVNFVGQGIYYFDYNDFLHYVAYDYKSVDFSEMRKFDTFFDFADQWSLVCF